MISSQRKDFRIDDGAFVSGYLNGLMTCMKSALKGTFFVHYELAMALTFLEPFFTVMQSFAPINGVITGKCVAR